jgi:hypothetical protein
MNKITQIVLMISLAAGTAYAGSGYTYRPPPPPPPRPAPVYRPPPPPPPRPAPVYRAPTPVYRPAPAPAYRPAPAPVYKPAPYRAPDRTYQRQQEYRRNDTYRDTQNRTVRESIQRKQADQDRYKRDLDRRSK